MIWEIHAGVNTTKTEEHIIFPSRADEEVEEGEEEVAWVAMEAIGNLLAC